MVTTPLLIRPGVLDVVWPAGTHSLGIMLTPEAKVVALPE
jgi:hypothetical protein